MHAILFCPATSELFLPDHSRTLAGSAETGAAPVLLSRLRAHGWPARARLLSPKAPQSAGSVPGTLVQLIDALPLLAQPPDATAELTYSPSLRAWHRAARLALELVRRTQDGAVALVFGNETSGLTNEEAALCSLPVTIPTDAGFSSLNLGAAVQVLAYELRMAALGDADCASFAHVVVTVPSGVTLETLFSLEMTVYRLPFPSTAMSAGHTPSAAQF